MKKLKLNSSYRLLKTISAKNNLTRNEEKLLHILWNTLLNQKNYYILYEYYNEETNDTKEIILNSCVAEFIDKVAIIYDISINELIKNDVFTIEEI